MSASSEDGANAEDLATSVVCSNLSCRSLQSRLQATKSVNSLVNSKRNINRRILAALFDSYISSYFAESAFVGSLRTVIHRLFASYSSNKETYLFDVYSYSYDYLIGCCNKADGSSRSSKCVYDIILLLIDSCKGDDLSSETTVNILTLLTQVMMGASTDDANITRLLRLSNFEDVVIKALFGRVLFRDSDAMSKVALINCIAVCYDKIVCNNKSNLYSEKNTEIIAAVRVQMKAILLGYLKTKLLIENKNNVNTNENVLKNMKFFVSTLTNDDFSSGLAETMVNTMKTSTEHSATLILFVLSNISSSVDINSIVVETNPTLFKLLRSSNAESRLKGLQIFECMSRTVCSRPDFTLDFFVTNVVGVLFDCLNGKNGIIASNMQRVSFLKAICNCSKHLPPADVAYDDFLTGVVIKNLAASCEKDNDAANRLLMSHALAGYLRIRAAALSRDTVDALCCSFLASKSKNVVSAGLHALSNLFATCGNDLARPLSGALLGAKAHLLSALKGYNAKAGTGGAHDALFALHILLEISKSYVEVMAEMQAMQVFSRDAKDNVFSALLTRALLGQMFDAGGAGSAPSGAESGGECAAAEERSIAAVSRHYLSCALPVAALAALSSAAASANLLPSAPKSSPGAVGAADKFPYFTYSNGSVAGFVLTVMACRDLDAGSDSALVDKLFVQLCGASADFAIDLSSTFARCSYHMVAVVEAVIAVDGDRENVPPSAGPRAIASSKLNRVTSLLFTVYRSLSSSSSNSKHDVLLTNLLMLCSCFGNSRKRSDQIFRAGSGGAYLFSKSSVTSLVGHMVEMTTMEMKSPSSSKSTLRSFVYAAEILFSACREEERGAARQLLFDAHLFQVLNNNCEAVLSFKDSEIAMYQRPAEVLGALKSRPVVVTDEELKITNADRKKDVARSSRKGTFGADFVEDEEWVESVKREKTKAVVERKQAELADEVRAKESEIAEVSARVSKPLLSTLYVLDALALFEDADIVDHVVCCDAGSQRMFSSLVLLLRSALTADRVLRCLTRFVSKSSSGSAINKTISQTLAHDIVNAVRILAQSLHRPLKKNETFADIYKDINYFSGSMARLLKSLQLLLLKNSSSSGGAAYLDAAVIASSIFICRGVASLHALLPGCEAVWVVVDSLWSRCFLEPLALAAGSGPARERVALLRPLQADVIYIVLSIMSKFANRVADSNTTDKTLSRIITGSRHLTVGEWTLLLSEIGILNTDNSIRLVVLKAMQIILVDSNSDVRDLVLADGAARDAIAACITSRLFILTTDESEELRRRSGEMYAHIEGAHKSRGLAPNYYSDMVELVTATRTGENVRVCICKAIAKGLMVHPAATEGLIASLQALFAKAVPQIDFESSALEPKPGAKGKADSRPPKREVKYLPDSHVRTRASIAMIVGAIGSEKALEGSAGITEVLRELLRFILTHGVADISAEVRSAMLAAARALIDGYGDSISGIIFTIIEDALAAKSPSDDEDVLAHDRRHQSTVVLLGAVGKHLDKDDPKLLDITNLMIESLAIPSESVQRAVAESLQSLVGVLKSSSAVTAEGSEIMKKYLDALIDTSLNSSDYGSKRGAAYGISAVVKGLGVSCLKTFDVIARLKDACSSSSVNAKQGSLFVFELISERMGLLFEPYVITIIPLLLRCFSDSNDHVREASQLTAKVIMAKLSAHGIKQVLTPIVTSLPDEKQWKTRQEAIRLLGTMAYCAPKQLAACLPQVVPRVVDANINDPHPKVKETAKKVLGDISSVIKSPEISRLAPVLLTALCDPANKTKEALEALLDCEFMHSIDPASLALLVPILSRALRDRGADLKRKASAITGNMMSMVSDAKSLVPYLHQLLPGLKDCLVDPIPDVRATSAKALGSLIAIGEAEEGLDDVIPYLLATMRSDSSSVERSGAAQGLSEVCCTLGTAKLSQVLQLLLSSAAPSSGKAAARESSFAREGLLWLLSFLPPLFRDKYEAFIELTLPVILQGLRDESEGVREVAMRSGQIYVSILGKSNTLLLLPALSNGMFNEDWRIRHSSVILLGDLLYLIGDTKAVGVADNADEDDGDFGYSGGSSGASRVAITIRAHIGNAETDKVFSVLYLARCDVSSSVRQLSLQVWKSVISNSPRTLSEIMPSLVRIIVEKLSSTQEEMQMSAARALGELVKKMAEKVLPIIIPFMQKGIRSSDRVVRQGVCVGLAEILSSGSRKTIEDHTPVLVLSLQQALCDESEEVRSQSAAAFHTLFKTIGHKAIDSVIPVLLEKITDVKDSTGEDGQGSSNDVNFFALLGLREVVMQQPRDLLEYILPKLLTAPMQASSSKALGAVSMAAGHHMNHHYRNLVSLLVGELAATSDNVDRLAAEGDEQAAAAERARLAAIQDAAGATLGACSTQGLHYLVTEIGRQIEHDSCSRRRRWGCFAADTCVRNSKADFSEYIPLLLKFLLSRCADSDTPTLIALSAALSTISACMPQEELMRHLDFMMNCINSTASSARHAVGSQAIIEERTGLDLLPLFTVPKSIDPFVAMFLNALLHGSIQQKEQAASSLGDLLNMCAEDVLRPCLIKTTGPLIRIVGDRLPAEVKAAILSTLCILLNKGAAGIKAFVPQLQTTFIKSLSDSSKAVRSRAVEAVGRLMPLVVRVDALLLELLALSYQTESTKIKGSLFDAVSVVLLEGGGKASVVSFDKIRSGLLEFLLDSSCSPSTEAAAEVRTSACKVMSALASYLSEADVTAIVGSLLGDANVGDVEIGSDNSGVISARLLALANTLSTAGVRASSCREAAFKYFKATLSATYSSSNANSAIDVASVRVSICGALLLLVSPSAKISADSDKRAEFKQGAQLVINNFTKDMAKLFGHCDNNLEVRRLVLYIFKNAAKNFPRITEKFASDMLPGVALGVKDVNLRIVNVAQRALKYICSNNEKLVMDFCASANNGELRDYVKRVVSRMTETHSDDEEW